MLLYTKVRVQLASLDAIINPICEYENEAINSYTGHSMIFLLDILFLYDMTTIRQCILHRMIYMIYILNTQSIFYVSIAFPVLTSPAAPCI